ncbi:MAG TPA: glycosyltransferase [Stellaceae bacterium]|nr:glycosyltransferase [Stellaceae bacterium]
MTASVLLYVQYLLGIGHLQRTLRIAEALAHDGIAVTLVGGGMPAALPRDPAIRFVQLPPVRALDARFELVDSAGRPINDALREERRAALLAAFAAARPGAVVIEGFPFARRAFRFELEPLIAAVRGTAPRPRLICSVRDIIVARDDPLRRREIVDRVRADFDAVLVHSDPAFIPFDASFPAAPEIADRLIYTGYVSPRAESRNGAATIGADEIVVSAGGGAAGHSLLRAALDARLSGCLAGLPWRFITGTNLPEADFAALCAQVPAGVIVERFRQNFNNLLRGCRVSVSQAGYNTVLDILAARARAVLVPFAAARETEQLLRAERLAALGAVELVRESELSPDRLARAIERAASHEPAAVLLDTGGAARSARLIAAMLGCRDRPAGDFATVASQGMIAR